MIMDDDISCNVSATIPDWDRENHVGFGILAENCSKLSGNTRNGTKKEVSSQLLSAKFAYCGTGFGLWSVAQIFN